MVPGTPALNSGSYAAVVLHVQLLSQQSQSAVGTGAQKWWLLVAGLFLISLCLLGAFIKIWRKTLPPARQPYIPPDLPKPDEIIEQTSADNETRGSEPGLGSGHGRWIQPPGND